ncbi:helix-turn-helix domain-containing protein [Streptomyces sp. SID3343]|uniref:helix-turn-helix domain-containing protein n=1 Tax=Streptomyces sp. SID3343 TaxID=2690260 RepID=UPI00136C9534|nr:transcriptional regulator [Streptomyces sp. SID3343]
MPAAPEKLHVRRISPDIESSWARSRLNGLHEDDRPQLVQGTPARDGSLARAAAPVLEQARAELAGTSLVLVLADCEARLLSIHCEDRSMRGALDGAGLVLGVELGEDQVGTNAVGTPLEIRQPLTVRKDDHFMEAFRRFGCHGHPVVHPITRRLEGVLDLGGIRDHEYSLVPAFVRRLVRDIEERLLLDSTRRQQRLLAAFQAASRDHRRRVLVVGQGLVLADPPALALLQPADHAAVRACADGAREMGAATLRLPLLSGRTVTLRCVPVDGSDGVLIDIVADEREGSLVDVGEVTLDWPLLVVGEPGSGRTTEAQRAVGRNRSTLDATDVLRQGEQAWITRMTELLALEGPPLIIENIQLLSEPLTALLASRLRRARRRTTLTSTPGEHLDGPHASLVALCNARRDLVPLRRRPYEVPRLAEHMLADLDVPGRPRFTADSLRVLATQPWPGNLAELRRVVATVASTRPEGDIAPSDLPASHRDAPAPASPFRQAEREVIVAAIEAAGGNKLRAARALSMSRSTLYNRMRVLRIT